MKRPRRGLGRALRPGWLDSGLRPGGPRDWTGSWTGGWPGGWRTGASLAAVLACAIAVFVLAWLTLGSSSSPGGVHSPGGIGPGPFAAPPHPRGVCGNRAVLGGGPSAPPRGAIAVRAGDDSAVDWTRPHATYWFAPGVHTLGTSQYSQITPGDGSTFIGAPGAVLDGEGRNHYAFTGTARGVTIEYLTIEDFGLGSSATTPSGDNGGQGVVNHDSGRDWVMLRNTVRYNAGAGIFLGTGDVARHNCLTGNGEYGFQAYGSNGASGITLSDNEISRNNTWNWEARHDGCGCSGGGKFWNVSGAVVTGNWVHDNRGPGLWADTDNSGFDIQSNYFSRNEGEAIIYEASYNALIRRNVFVDNAWRSGSADPGFPSPAVYISESGSDRQVPGRYGSSLRISDNVFINNWGGVVLWENADRFCGSPANTSAGFCTLVDPATVKVSTCDARNIAHEPYFSSCRWRTKNVLVDHNVFYFDPATIGPACTAANECGFNGIFSQFGTFPEWSPYQGAVVEDHITFDQNNRFSSNTYRGPWRFMIHGQGNAVSWATWRGSPYRQDAGSTLTP